MITFESAEGIAFSPQKDTHETYFEDIIGVSKPIGGACQFVKIKVNKSLWPYIESKPLHPSQTVIERGSEYIILQLEIIPNYEFYAQVLGFGPAVEVLEPTEVRVIIREKLEESVKKYY